MRTFRNKKNKQVVRLSECEDENTIQRYHDDKENWEEFIVLNVGEEL